MSLCKINDVELDIDMEDYDFQVKYEKAFDRLEQDEKELQKIGRASEITKAYCEMFNRLFDNIFGEGTSQKLFDGKFNMSKTEQVYSEFIGICAEQVKTINDRRTKLANKYKPNRAQRRARR